MAARTGIGYGVSCIAVVLQESIITISFDQNQKEKIRELIHSVMRERDNYFGRFQMW